MQAGMYYAYSILGWSAKLSARTVADLLPGRLPFSYRAGRPYRVAAVLIFLLVTVIGMLSCAEKMDYMNKVSSTLLQQVELRREQIASPNPERLKQMQDMGLSTVDLNKQLVFVYVKEPLGTAQAEDLSAIGVHVHADSWIPPVGSHPLGFFIADMPADKLEALAARDYVDKLDTAERQSLPQCPVTNY
jgi:hypothetical protein